MKPIRRREFLGTAAATAAVALVTPTWLAAAARALPNPSAAKLPRWRGFNLLEKFVKHREGNSAFRESDFQIMQEWDFDFARLPMSYHCWSEPDPERWLAMDE